MHNIYPWQQKQWQYLLTRKNGGNLPHSLLLVGQPELGKIDFAMAVAELLLCKQPQAKACGVCRSCKLIQAGNHPDLNLLQPEEKGKAIKVDQVRDITNMVTKQSHQGGSQVIIIDPADAMNIAANNALLKTLEEPPGDVVIMLLAANAALLPATIRSRCQKIVLQAPETKIVSEQHQEVLDLVAGKIDALKFAKEHATQDLKVILNCFQQVIIDMIRDTPAKRLFHCYDKVTNLIKYSNNNLNKQLVLEDIGLDLEAMLHVD